MMTQQKRAPEIWIRHIIEWESKAEQPKDEAANENCRSILHHDVYLVFAGHESWLQNSIALWKRIIKQEEHGRLNENILGFFKRAAFSGSFGNSQNIPFPYSLFVSPNKTLVQVAVKCREMIILTNLTALWRWEMQMWEPKQHH